MSVYHEGNGVTLHHGDCLDVLRTLPDASVDSVVTDPPYGLEFMGKDWDAPWKASSVGRGVRVEAERADEMTERGKGHATAGGPYLAARVDSVRVAGLPFQEWCEAWATECLRVLKPGGHLLAFGGTRTWHRLACAVEDAGFEVRDSIAWVYGSGFPKSLNVSKALGDKRCHCGTVESDHDEAAESQAEHGVRGVLGRHVPEAVRVDGGPGSILLPSVPESGAPSHGTAPRIGSGDGAEPGMEGRRDLQAPEGELCGPALREVPTRVPGDGEDRRLRDGAPSRDGSTAGTLPTAVGSGESHQPRPAGQPAGEPGAVPVERGSQAWGGWPVCGRCGKPSIPDGLGTAAKPAFEPVVVARKPLVGTVAGNVLAHGTGALNVDACRVDGKPRTTHADGNKRTRNDGPTMREGFGVRLDPTPAPAGRWPTNVVLDETQAAALDEQSGNRPGATSNSDSGYDGRDTYGKGWTGTEKRPGYADQGGASRFFYTAKADASERPRVNGTAHPTVKPLALMRWLVRLVTPPGGTVLEPFAGSGTTVEACLLEGFHCIAIEKTDEYLPLVLARIHRQRNPVAAIKLADDDLGLFDLEGMGA